MSRKLGGWLTIVLFVTALPEGIAATPIGNLDIWYDEAPVPMGRGTTTWKGKTSVPLNRDEATGQVKGEGSFSYSYLGLASRCSFSCQATTAISVSGKVSSTVMAFDVLAKSTTSKCTARCPRGSATVSDQHDEGFSDKIVLPVGTNAPLRHQSVAGGPALFYQMAQPCDADSGKANAVESSITPAGGKWEVTWLRLVTLDDIRRRGQPNSNRYGYTAHDFRTAISIIDKTTPARNGDGYCYWVERVDFGFVPIEVAIPGLNFGAASCEIREIVKHEEKHVKNYKFLLGSYAKEFQKLVMTSGLPPPSAPIYIKTEGAGHDMAQKKTDAWVDRLQPVWLDKRDKSDAALDTAAEYSAIKAMCPNGWR